MTNLFVSILNMSITASYVTIAVIWARILLRRDPKIFSYILWSAVIIRLVFPVSFTSSFSLLRRIQPEGKTDTGAMAFVPHNIGMQQQPEVDLGISSVGNLMNEWLPAPAPGVSVNPMQMILWAGSLIWLAGVVSLLLYSIISYLRILRRIRTATLLVDNIFETDQIATPFVCGFVKPRIYLPTGLSGQELSYILLHEQTHIRRRDYLIKPVMFLATIVHWFNPLMWLAYKLMSKDMEMSCDEHVVRKLGPQIKGSYSESLLALSVNSSGLQTGSPLAFGESSVKARIKNILAYRQPSTIYIACIMVVVAALIIGCIANPKTELPTSQPLYSGYAVEHLMENKTMYIGDNSKVAALIGEMPWPEGAEKTGMELKTGTRPYELTVNFQLNNYAGVWDEDIEAITRNAFFANSVLLLSLIGNADHINYTLNDHTGQYNGASYSFIFSREEINKLLSGDVRKYAADEAELRLLIDRMNGMVEFN